MKRIIYSGFFTSIALIVFALIATSSSNGRAFAANDGNTGAPGEGTTCRTCHGTGFGTTVSIAVKGANGFPVSSYIPGNTYEVEVAINTIGSPSRFGFQLLSLLDAGGNYNAWSNPSGNARIANAGGRSYTEHAGKSVSNTFTVDWTAPAAGAGSVRFYAGGAAVNNNGGTSGDGGNVSQVLISEGVNTSINEGVNAEFALFPNPVNDYVTIEGLNDSKFDRLMIYDLQGKLVFQTIESRVLQTTTIDLYSFETGIYFIQGFSENRQILNKKVVVQ